MYQILRLRNNFDAAVYYDNWKYAALAGIIFIIQYLVFNNAYIFFLLGQTDLVKQG